MKTASEFKKALDDLRRQIQGLNHYIAKVKPVQVKQDKKDKISIVDRNSLTNLEFAKNTARSLETQIEEQLYRLEGDIRKEKSEKIDASYDEKLKNINSPTKEMLKNSQDIMGSRRESVLGGGLMRKSSEEFISNLKQALIKRAAKGSEDGNRK